MRYFIDVRHHIMRYESLVVCALLEIIQERRTSSHPKPKCIFLGYPFAKKGWRVCDLETNETFISRDVIFCEKQFPLARAEQQDAFDPGAL